MKAVSFSTLFLVGFALAPAIAYAQCHLSYHSIEPRVARADVVVAGEISRALRRKVEASESSSAAGRRIDHEAKVEYVLTVKVHETLKGEEADVIELVDETYSIDRRYDQWAEARSTILWFLGPPVAAGETMDDGAPARREFSMLRIGTAASDEQGFKTSIPPVFSMDFTVLHEEKAILARARQFAKKQPGPLRIHSITIPHEVAAQCSPPCDGNALVVPVDASLEETARRLIASPQEFLPGNAPLDSLAGFQLRLGGVEALQYFKSNENAALLRSLLDDSTAVYRTFDAGSRESMTVKEYPIRAKAYGILRQWNVDAPRPVTEVITPEE